MPTVSSPASPKNDLELLKLALNLSQQAVYEWDLDTGSFTLQENADESIPFFGDVMIRSEHDILALMDETEQRKYRVHKQQLQDGKQQFELKYTLKLPDGREFNLRDSGALVTRDGEEGCKVVGTIGLCDRYSHQTVEERNSSMEYKTRNYPPVLMAKLEKVLSEARNQQASSAFMFISIDNMPMLINCYGYEIATNIIQSIPTSLSEKLGGNCIVERIHRDQFGVILRDASNKAVEKTAVEINRFIQDYGASVTEMPIHIISSIGSVTMPEHASNPIDVFDRACIAVNNTASMRFHAYDASMDNPEHSRHQMEMAQYLRRAIQEKRLCLAFQPIVSTKDGSISHYECLLRMINEQGQLTSAGMLIPLAERMGMIDMIDRLVLDMVVEELLNDPDVHLAFNVSSLTTDDRMWLKYFNQLLDEHPEIATRMTVEITETAAQRNLSDAAYFVASIQAKGCQVALDDFGSGYTSFRQLKTLSVDVIKIDGSFIRSLVDNHDNRFFVKTLLDFTKGFGLKAVAECVETGETAKVLMNMGVDYLQGFYFGKGVIERPWKEEGSAEKQAS